MDRDLPLKIGALAARLCDLEAAGRRADDRVVATLHLASGARVLGTLMGLNGQLLELREKGAGSTTWVDLARIEAITVDKGDDARDLVTAGAVERPGDAPGELELRKRADAIGVALGILFRVEVPEADLAEAYLARLALGRLLEDLFGALDALNQRDGGLGVARVKVLEGEPGVSRDGELLLVRAALREGPRGRLGRAALEAAIADAL
jgi:hypothetical protein